MTVAAWTEGTFRSATPTETWQNVQPLMKEAGITRVADLTHLDTSGIAVHAATRPAATTLVTSQGKGLTPILSKVSAVMESLELWYAEQPITPELRSLPERDVRPEIGYPLAALDRDGSSLLSMDTSLDWSRADSIVTGRNSYVPTEYLRLDRRSGRTWQPPLFVKSTNGLASGNSIDEAALHALCEIVERDAIGQASPNITARRVHPDRLESVVVAALVDSLERRGNTVGIFDLPSRADVPCFAATVGGDHFAPRLFAGFGCHPDSAVAAIRAITEAVQNRVTLIAGTRDDLPVWRYDQLRSGRGAHDAPESQAVIQVQHFTGSFRDNVERVAKAVRGVTGFEPLIVQLTPLDCAIHVVRVIAPGLHFHDMAGLR